MAVEKITGSVEAVEVEADKILEEARTRANQITLKAREEASRIIASELSLGEVEAECEKMVHKAREEADQKVRDSREEAAKIRDDVEGKVGGIVERMVGIVTGASLE